MTVVKIMIMVPVNGSVTKNQSDSIFNTNTIAIAILLVRDLNKPLTITNKLAHNTSSSAICATVKWCNIT